MNSLPEKVCVIFLETYTYIQQFIYNSDVYKDGLLCSSSNRVREEDLGQNPEESQFSWIEHRKKNWQGSLRMSFMLDVKPGEYDIKQKPKEERGSRRGSSQ